MPLENLVHHPISLQRLLGHGRVLRLATNMRIHAQYVVPLNVCVMLDVQAEVFIDVQLDRVFIEHCHNRSCPSAPGS
ncbi:hypothetical protein D3C85_1493050 [compost metagenome]